MLDKNQIYEELKSKVNAENIFIDEPMSKHTSFRTGGLADIFVKIEKEQELENILKYTTQNNIPLIVIGNGTNLLVRDNGVRGIVVQLKMQNIVVEDNKNSIKITADAGTPISKISNIAKSYGAEGLEFAVGIPGTIGGAIKMNAGAYGSEMKDIIKETEYIEFNRYQKSYR